MLEKIKEIDTQLFIYLNGMHNTFFDSIMFWASDKLFWVPFYVIIAALIIREFKKHSVLVFICIGLLIILCDQTASTLIKKTVKRLRPSHEPMLQDIIYISSAGPGGQYGFISSHAANTFGFATFLILILPKKYNVLKVGVLFWAILVSYSRIYNGVHYPADIIVAMFLGIMYGCLVKALLDRYKTKLFSF